VLLYYLFYLLYVALLSPVRTWPDRGRVVFVSGHHVLIRLSVAKKTWAGCGMHIPSAMAGVPEDEWCTCEPKKEVDGKSYPPSAKSFLQRILGDGSKKEAKQEL
jgi:hypothetical protein